MGKKNKVFSISLTVIMLIMIMPVGLLEVSAEGLNSAGTGTNGKIYYKIKSTNDVSVSGSALSTSTSGTITSCDGLTFSPFRLYASTSATTTNGISLTATINVITAGTYFIRLGNGYSMLDRISISVNGSSPISTGIDESTDNTTTVNPSYWIPVASCSLVQGSNSITIASKSTTAATLRMDVISIELLEVAPTPTPTPTPTPKPIINPEKPMVSNLNIVGLPHVGNQVDITYDFYDPNGIFEDTNETEINWYRANKDDFENYVKIENNNNYNRSIELDDIDGGKDIYFSILPITFSKGEGNDEYTVGEIVYSPRIYVMARPQVSNIEIVGSFTVGSFLRVIKDYYDAEGDSESGTVYKWYRTMYNSYENKELIEGEINSYYEVKALDENKYIFVEVTPRSNKPPMTGVSKKSPICFIESTNINPPKIDNLIIQYDIKKGRIDSSYTFLSENGEGELGTEFIWYSSNSNDSSAYTKITTVNSRTYTVDSRDINKWFKLKVIPKADKAIGNYYWSNEIKIEGSKQTNVTVSKSSGSSGGHTYVPSSSIPTTVPEDIISDITFSDIKGHWANNEVEKLANMGIIVGYPDGTFKPDGKINVDEFIKMIVVQMGHSLESSNDYWANTYLQKAEELGLIRNGEYDRFDREITRTEIARIVIRSINSEHNFNGEMKNVIIDINDINKEDKKYILRAYSLGIIKGYEDGSFRGSVGASRAEAAVILIRLANRK